MKSIKDIDVKGKRVLVRCDFNVPMDEKGNILDDFRIQQNIPTIKYLIGQGAKVILMSHLGEPDGKFKKEFSLSLIQEKLLEYLDVSVAKAKDCIGREIELWVQQMQPGEVLLLENLRFHKGETENDLDFAKELSKLGDIFVNDAFSVSHRIHASIVGIPEFLPSVAGLLFEQECNNLCKVFKKPKRPLVGIIGGAKVGTKIKPIKGLLKKVDYLIIGGKLADVILRAKGISVGKVLPGLEIQKEVEEINLADPKLKLPIDVIAVLENVYARKTGPANVRKEELALDIGPESVKMFSKIIKEAKTIFWSGPLGKIEQKEFVVGTLGVATAIGQSEAFSIAGGNNTVSFIKEYNLQNRFSYLSTAGGAMLDYLNEETLPGIRALEKTK